MQIAADWICLCPISGDLLHKKRFRIEILLRFLQYLLVVCGHLWYTEKRSGGFLFDAGKGLCMQSGVSADRKDRKILCMTSRRGTGTDKGTAGKSRCRKAKRA